MDTIVSGQLVAVLLGLMAMGVAVREVAMHRRLRRVGIHVQGVVVRHEVHSSGESRSRHAVVNFVDADGAPHEYRSALSGTGKLPVGRQVPMIYLPGAPKKARIDISSRRRAAIAIPAGFGMVFTAVGILWLVSGTGVGHG
ncbi:MULTISPECIES: DUF3592 domain-containing protein [unclassified Streptomyces]|uniref:DUF3592 domain-containing protein n=1 Tax=unclassified Streptomyces TaxID=2593676 RepID=UPI0037F7CBF0